MLLIVFVVFVVVIFIIGRTFYPDNLAETFVGGDKKGLKTRGYKTYFATARKTVQEVIPQIASYQGTGKLQMIKLKLKI